MKSLIQRLLAGDDEAVALLYQTYSPKILRYLQNKLPAEEAKEVVSDVFLDVIDTLPTLHKQENLSAYLYKIAHNKMVDIYRKKKIKSIFLSHMPFLEIIASELSDPEFQLEKDRLCDKIEMALNTISEKYQQILRLHYEEDVPVKELALIFNISAKAAESMLFRARQSFKQAYGRA